MNNAIRIHQYGGPEVLNLEPVEIGAPAAGEVRVRHTAIGLNFIDVYQRTGLYPLGDFPQTLGMEAAGVIETVGSDVADFAVGDRVAYAMSLGAYCNERLMGVEKLVKLPDGIEDRTAAAMMLQGMTARYLLKSSYPVQAGDSILVMAAAGGVGTLLCQWARHLGVTVIGCVGSPEKAQLAQQNGCHHTILYKEEDVAARVREITGGEGVAAAYDSVGQATLMASLDSLRPTGTFVSYGNASGPISDFNVGVLAQKGSLYLQRPTLATYIRNRELLNQCAGDLFDVVQSGAVKVRIGQTYPLAEVAQAHRDLEARKTTGATVLLP
ncbi:quinone oxidoreductase family protein [Sedimenticola sp.]|uniref:quinone oxidoreductase family protein n=1 Tax=Sedimenticola sp. TaxID=1940285 RepID=UPI003D0A250D